jgi:hypothetical protein
MPGTTESGAAPDVVPALVEAPATPPMAGRTCRSCGSTAGRLVLDLGEQPSAERFVRAPDVLPAPCRLRMWLCHDCRLAQLAEDPGAPEAQVEVVEPLASQEQTRSALELMDRWGLLGAGRTFLEIGSPHGHPWADRLRALGMTEVPATHDGPVDVVLDVYGLLHEPDQDDAIARRASALGEHGTLVCQLHPLGAVLDAAQFQELRHGHFAYWSLPALDAALGRHGLGVHRAVRFDYDRGTLVVLALRRPSPDAETVALLRDEEPATRLEVVGALQEQADRTAAALSGWLEGERDAGRVVWAYGAAGRAVPLLCHAGVDRTLLPAVVDASEAKQGCTMPGTDIPIVGPDALVSDPPDRVLVLVTDLLAEVSAAFPQVVAGGGRWVVLDPEPREVLPS